MMYSKSQKHSIMDILSIENHFLLAQSGKLDDLKYHLQLMIPLGACGQGVEGKNNTRRYQMKDAMFSSSTNCRNFMTRFYLI